MTNFVAKERPILFSAPMVRAILDGTKTQTRRAVKPQPYIDDMGNFCWNGRNFGQNFRGPHIQAIASPLPSSKTGRVCCPYGKPGDRLWVREAFCDARNAGYGRVLYRANPEDVACGWKPSIHMPRALARITLEITSVRVERLQEISETDALAEGIERPEAMSANAMKALDVWDGSERECFNALNQPVTQYRRLWNSINGAGSWEANPWVWVVEFKRVQP